MSGQPVRIPRVLSVAGTDPSGGAGIHADLKSIAAAGGYGMAVVTALVAQNTRGVRSVHTPPVAFLVEQLEAVSDDVEIDAVKIGMLGGAEAIGAVSSWLDRVRPPIVVLDPVMVATSGDRLLERDAEDALRDLCRRADLVTPNVPELALLVGSTPARTWTEVRAQAERLSRTLGVRVLAKGSHLDGPDAVDALVDAATEPPTVVEYPARRVATTSTHGTGCSLSSAIATRVASDGDWDAAVAESKRWLLESIRGADALHVGSGNGPVHHFAGLWGRGGLRTRPTPDEVREEWWRSIADVRAEIDRLPFVRGLGDGTLPSEPFLWYLAQDALYLRDYARLLAEASRQAPSRDEQAFWARSASGALDGELQLHDEWLSPVPGGEVAPAPSTIAYLDHLHASAREGYDVLIAALLPCFWLYQDVGVRLERRSHAAHPYASWLETYADPGFSVATETALGWVARAAARADEDHRRRMADAFRASAVHEREFFAAPLLEESPPSVAGSRPRFNKSTV